MAPKYKIIFKLFAVAAALASLSLVPLALSTANFGAAVVFSLFFIGTWTLFVDG